MDVQKNKRKNSDNNNCNKLKYINNNIKSSNTTNFKKLRDISKENILFLYDKKVEHLNNRKDNSNDDAELKKKNEKIERMSKFNINENEKIKSNKDKHSINMSTVSSFEEDENNNKKNDIIVSSEYAQVSKNKNMLIMDNKEKEVIEHNKNNLNHIFKEVCSIDNNNIKDNIPMLNKRLSDPNKKENETYNIHENNYENVYNINQFNNNIKMRHVLNNVKSLKNWTDDNDEDEKEKEIDHFDLSTDSRNQNSNNMNSNNYINDVNKHKLINKTNSFKFEMDEDKCNKMDDDFSKRKILKKRSVYNHEDSDGSFIKEINDVNLDIKNDNICCSSFKKSKKKENHVRIDKSNVNDNMKELHSNSMGYIDIRKKRKKELSKELKNMDWLIYTIRYMDYRRLRRRFSGIRKPISKKIVFIITIFCLILISWKYFNISYENNKFSFSFEIQTSLLFFVEAILLTIGIIIFAKFQTRLSLHWPIYASYIFIICAVILLLFFENDKLDKNSRGEHILMLYGIVQLSLIIIVKIIIFSGPLLAIYGFFCPCTEHCRILKKKISTNKLNITISRYNDFAGMCGNNVCCLCLCVYRSFYRLVNCFYNKFSNFKFKMITETNDEAPFSHQLRYKGKTDIYGRPHGYGEWIEDHSYGEKLRGFWYHGYPVGPFISQEIGSGSLFVNTRVGFAACVGKDWSDVRYGVACTECSISGHFFNDFPLTHFFNSKIEKNVYGRLPTNRYDIIIKDILKENYEDILCYDLKWCFNMLKVNSGTTNETCSNNCMISLDHVTMSLKVHNYKRIDTEKRKNDILDEINIKLVHVPHEKKKTKKIHKRDKFKKLEEKWKQVENDENALYINQNKVYTTIRNVNSSSNNREMNVPVQENYHSYYKNKFSDKYLDSVDDDIYLYKMNKTLQPTEIHKASYWYESSDSKNQTKQKEDKSRDKSRDKSKDKNKDKSKDRNRDKSKDKSKDRNKDRNKDKNKSINNNIEAPFNNSNVMIDHQYDDDFTCNILELPKNGYENFEITKNYELDNINSITHRTNVHTAHDKNSNSYMNPLERNVINNKKNIPNSNNMNEPGNRNNCSYVSYPLCINECKGRKGNSVNSNVDEFVVDIKGYEEIYQRNNKKKKTVLNNNIKNTYNNYHPNSGCTRQNFRNFEKYLPNVKDVSKKDASDIEENKDQNIDDYSIFSQNEYSAFLENRKENIYDNMNCLLFEKQNVVGIKREESSEKSCDKNMIMCNKKGIMDMPNSEDETEMDKLSKHKKEKSKNKELLKKKKFCNKMIEENSNINEMYENYDMDNKEHYEYDIDKNDYEAIPIRKEILKSMENEHEHEHNSNNKIVENKNIFMSDIFKSFIKSGVQRNMKKNCNIILSSDEIDGISLKRSNVKRRKNVIKKSSYRLLGSLKENNRRRSSVFDKSTKKLSMNKMKNSKIKSFVNKYSKQGKKSSIFITSGNKKWDKLLRSKKYKKNYKNERIIGTIGNKMRNLNESYGNFNTPTISPTNIKRNKTIAQVFAEEDEWEQFRHQHKQKIVIDGWQSLSLKQNLNFMPEEILIYIHGYNVKLNHGCSQLAHLVSFSKLPAYIQPFVFHWEGAMWGAFSALSYPVAKKRTEMTILGNSFRTFIKELINSGIKNVHIISHSCGSRLFFNGFRSCVEDNLFYNVLKNKESEIKKGNNVKSKGMERSTTGKDEYVSDDDNDDSDHINDNNMNSSNKMHSSNNLTNSNKINNINDMNNINNIDNINSSNNINNINHSNSINHSNNIGSKENTTSNKNKGNLKTNTGKKNKKQKKQIIVKTVILLNPDYPLDTFLEKDFFMLRSHCNHIVMYGDTRDQALTYSETWNREKCLGKRIFKLKLPLYKIHHYEDYLNINSDGNKFMKKRCKVEQYKVCDSVLFPISSYADEENKNKLKDIDNKDQEKKNKRESKCINKAFKTDKNVLNSYTLDLNDVGEGEGGVSCVSEDVSQNYLNENFLKTLEFSDTSLKTFKSKKKFRFSTAFKKIKRKWLFKKQRTNIYFNENTLSKRYSSMKFKKKSFKMSNQKFKKNDTVYISFDKYAWLDMDVIDTTFVETNVDFLKHSFYQVKREIIDDIREVLISNIRAHERVSRLDRRRGNVFVLRVAPAGVGSLHR